MSTLQSQLETIAQLLHTQFPNLTLAYLSSLNYSGYANGVSTQTFEPYAYETGFAMKNVIADQLAGDPALNFDPSLGPVMAPWLAWGPYFWTNGLLGRSDGFTWTCQDAKSDGAHPSPGSGTAKVADFLLNFFKTDDTTPWFLAP